MTKQEIAIELFKSAEFRERVIANAFMDYLVAQDYTEEEANHIAAEAAAEAHLKLVEQMENNDKAME